MRRRSGRVAAAAAVATMVVLGRSGPAHAEPLAAACGPARDGPVSDPGAAEALFQSALGALDRGDWAEACPKFTLAMKLDPTIGTLLNVAKCQAHEGQVLRAWQSTGEALAMNRCTADATRRQQLEDYARKLMVDLEPRLSRVVVKVTPADVGATVVRDGVVSPSDLRGEAIPVERGTHRFEIGAPGFTPVERTVEVGEGETEVLEIALVRPAQPGAVDTSFPIAPGLLVGALGLAGLGVGVGAGVGALGAASDLEARCPDPKRCDDTGLSFADDGRTMSTVSTIGFVAGGILLAAGVTLTLISFASGEEDDTVARGRVRLTASPGAGFVGVERSLW